MRRRNALFVAGFPYFTVLIGYFAISILDFGNPEKTKYTSLDIAAIIAGFIFILTGGIYMLYWLISTAAEIRKATKDTIPSDILLFIPIANYWWLWRYGKAVDTYTKGKLSAPLVLVLFIGLGALSLGILQDAYNKLPKPRVTKKQPQT